MTALSTRKGMAVFADHVSPELAKLRQEVSLRTRYTDPFDEKEEREQVTIITTMGGEDYEIVTPLLPKKILKKHKYLSRILERMVMHAVLLNLEKEDVIILKKNILLYYLCQTDIPIDPVKLQADYVFEDPETLLGECPDGQGLVDHWFYNHWSCFLNFTKLGFWGKNVEEPKISKNFAERKKKKWLMPSGFDNIQQELTATVSPEEYDDIIEAMNKSRSISFETPTPPKGKGVNLPEEETVTGFNPDIYRPATPKRSRRERAPSPGPSNPFETEPRGFSTPIRPRSTSPNKNPLYGGNIPHIPAMGIPRRQSMNWRKSVSQKEWEKVTGMKIVEPPAPTSGLTNLMINPPEAMDTSNPKWKDVQRFDDWTQDLERYLKIKK